MSKSTTTDNDAVLDEQVTHMLSDAPVVMETSPSRMQALRNRVMRRVDDDITNASRSFRTIRNDDEAWIEIAPKIKKKVLFENPDTGTEAYLLKAEPGAEAPPHVHEYDEHCIVLEGELTFVGGVHLEAGDYHFAPAGSEHGIARTDTGVLVYIQSGQQGASIAI